MTTGVEARKQIIALARLMESYAERNGEVARSIIAATADLRRRPEGRIRAPRKSRKLSAETVAAIEADLENPELGQTEIAAKYGTTQHQVSIILNGRRT